MEIKLQLDRDGEGSPALIETFEEVAACARESLAAYVSICDPLYVWSETGFNRALCRLLQKVSEGLMPRLTISVPPQHGKSRLVTRELATWHLGNNPAQHVVVASYGAGLSTTHSRLARHRVNSDTFRAVFGCGLWEERAAAGEWYLDKGGSYRAVGVEGELAGHGADMLIIDDPHKDHAEAHSKARRDAVWDWFTTTAMPRLAPDGRILIISTRWHVDDLIGRIKSSEYREQLADMGVTEEWAHVNLRGIAREDDILERVPGGALFPERYPAEVIRARMAAQGSYMAAALYDGEPVVKGGNYVNAAQLRSINRIDVPPRLTWMRYWDLATEEKESADFTAGVRGAMGPAPDAPNGPKDCLYLADMINAQMAWPRARQVIVNTAVEEKILVGIEAVGGFKTAFQNVRENLPPDVAIREYGADTDKLTRALPWIALAENGKLFLVNGDWVADFRNQAEAFPNGAHNDMIDAVSGVHAMLNSRVLPMPVPLSHPDKYARAVRERRRRCLDG